MSRDGADKRSIIILVYYNMIGENRIRRVPIVTDLVSRKIGENLMKKKGPEGPSNYLVAKNNT